MKPNSITITYLTKVSFASLNGADKDVDNINPIKKITLSNNQELPYLSSQAIRRALRDRLEELGWEISVITPGEGKTPPVTAADPTKYIDDDIFGYMNATARSQRTSPIRVESLVALNEYKGNLDYATNFMDSKLGGEPSIFETEVHSGIYRGTVLIELDRIGNGITENNQYKAEDFISNDEKCKRLIAFINALQNLWSSGRQSRFLSDISPKFIVAALMKVKNPIFLESVNIDKNGNIEVEKLKSVVSDYENFIDEYVFAAQKASFEIVESVLPIKEGFGKIENWIKSYYSC
jgi:CRISPR-associated protein Cst2